MSKFWVRPSGLGKDCSSSPFHYNPSESDSDSDSERLKIENDELKETIRVLKIKVEKFEYENGCVLEREQILINVNKVLRKDNKELRKDNKELRDTHANGDHEVP
jgi:ssDNA-binding replication factor A large subunit